jgi:hypothetical protein
MPYLNLLSFETWNQVFLVFSVAFYLLQCYAGYKCVKWLVAVVGFGVGFMIGFFVSAGYFTQAAYIPAAIGIGAGIGMAFLAFRLYLVGIFIYCGYAAYSAVSNLPIENEGSMAVLRAVLCIGAFIIVGILAVKFAKLCIIAVTAITGSINAVNLLRTPIEALDENTVLRIAVIILIAVTGIIIQRMTTK